jgi:hypothetical protein
VVEQDGTGWRTSRIHIRTRIRMAAIAFDWAQYLRIARELALRTDEAALRTAISRAYYYIYHLALKRVTDNNPQMKFDEGGSHAQLWAVFSENPEPACKSIGNIGNRLRDRRVRADYRDFYPRIEEDVPSILADAESCENLFLGLDPRHPNANSRRR